MLDFLHLLKIFFKLSLKILWFVSILAHQNDKTMELNYNNTKVSKTLFEDLLMMNDWTATEELDMRFGYGETPCELVKTLDKQEVIFKECQSPKYIKLVDLMNYLDTKEKEYAVKIIIPEWPDQYVENYEVRSVGDGTITKLTFKTTK